MQAAEATVAANTMAARQQQQQQPEVGMGMGMGIGGGGVHGGGGDGGRGGGFADDSYQMSAGLNVPVTQGKKVRANARACLCAFADEQFFTFLLYNLSNRIC
jgi:hypothetical protein